MSTPRATFALTGPSRALDLRTQAVRADIADVRLASQVFAPHYVEAIERRIASPTDLRAGRDAGAETLARLDAGNTFEMLDLTGGIAWGIVPSLGLVGYLDASALDAG